MYSVLYVDDEADLLDLTQLYLEDTGLFQIDKANSASSAQQKLKQRRYDAIIADYQMPHMDGIEFLKYVRQNFGNIPFILFTGKGREEVVIEAINNGADYYLQKGGDPDPLFAELTHKLRQAIQLRKDQATIRINAERLRRAQEIGQTGSWEYTIATRKMWGSDEGFRIFGIDSPAGEVPVGNVEACIQQADISRQALTDLICHGKEYNIVYTINPADGSDPRIIQSIAELEKDCEGNPVKVLGIIRDITEKTDIQSALRESEERFADVINNAGEWIWEVDAEGIYRYSSPMGQQIHGYEADELVGIKHFYDLFAPEKREEFKQKALRAFRQKIAFRHFINSSLHKNGETIILETSGTPRLDTDGTLLGYRGADLDITSRKKAEEELQENEAKFRLLVNQLQDSVIIITCDGTILFGNPSAYSLVGLPQNETVMGSNFSRFIDPGSLPQVMSDLEAIASGNSVRISEYRIKTADNSTRWVEASGTKINYQGQDAIMVSIRDVTERRQAREELELINKKLELLSSITRHDIINKVTVILGNIRTARKKCADPEIVLFLDKLEAAAKSIRGQTEFTRIYQILGSHEPLWQDLRGIIPIKSVPPEIHIESSIDGIEIYADPMLEKVFDNLLDNSVKHGGHVTEVRIFSESLPEGIRIVWEDNGSGIPASDKEYIFDRSFGNNSGLGLFLSREILAITGIGIRETGIAGNGARFEITIPADHCRPLP
jgi:PAS domain S-box-containing protein